MIFLIPESQKPKNPISLGDLTKFLNDNYTRSWNGILLENTGTREFIPSKYTVINLNRLHSLNERGLFKYNFMYASRSKTYGKFNTEPFYIDFHDVLQVPDIPLYPITNAYIDPKTKQVYLVFYQCGIFRGMINTIVRIFS